MSSKDRPPDHGDVCGTTLDGHRVTDGELLDLVQGSGSLVILRGPGQRLRRGDWADTFAALASARQQYVSVCDDGRYVRITGNDDHIANTPPCEQSAVHVDQSAARAAHPSQHRRTPSLRIVPPAEPTEDQRTKV